MLKLPGKMRENYGRNIDRMPELLKAEQIPISVAGFMKARLEQGKEFPDLWGNYADTSDLIVYPKGNDREISVLLTVNNREEITRNGRKALDLIRTNNLASNYGAKVGKLKDLGRKGLIKVPRNKITTGTYLTKEQILNEQVWRILARHPDEVPVDFAEDSNLLKVYEKEVRTSGHQNNMAIYLGDSLNDQTTLKAWCVYRLEVRSDADGWCGLGSSDGRLLGIAPEALVAQDTDVTQKIRTYTPGQVKEALNDLGFQGLTKTLIDKLRDGK